jgi:L-2,4-diaminobutyrate decarboxylase
MDHHKQTFSYQEIFSPDHFQKLGHEIVDLLAMTIKRNLASESKVIDWEPPQMKEPLWKESLPIHPRLSLDDLTETLNKTILKQSHANFHPKSMAHQLSTPIPLAALCDFIRSFTNQITNVYEAGPVATLMERQVIDWLCTLIDEKAWAQAGGVLTSGGSAANLTALLAARQFFSESQAQNIWFDGVFSFSKARFIVSENAHYSIARAVAIMGFGTEAIIPVAVDLDGRMNVESLKKTYSSCLANQEPVIAVVAVAGSTATGSIDDLQQIGEFCQSNHLWLHVDAVHGASALFSNKHRQQLNGLALADSVVWDGHKLGYMPALLSAVLFRNKNDSEKAFSQNASYLFHEKNQHDENYNLAHRTLECTKPLMALPIWTSFKVFGINSMGLLVDRVFEQARCFAEKISKHPDFELLMQPQTNIVCYRYCGSVSKEAMNDLQDFIHQEVLKCGLFWISKVSFKEQVWLRSTLMNPFTGEREMDELLAHIVKISALKTSHASESH